MTTRALTSGTAINKMKVIYPVSAKRTEKIGDFFSKLDRQIELEEQKLELLQQQKKDICRKSSHKNCDSKMRMEMIIRIGEQLN